jgi:NAD(P)-dependent dehydrogenase (short-subunit alcohol dehydrogenase family)
VQQSEPFNRGEPRVAPLMGRFVLVAGGTGNVGQYVVRALLQHGAAVVVPSRSEERLAALRATVPERLVDALIGIETDISDERKAAELIRELEARRWPLYAAIAALGRFVAAPSMLAAPLRDLRAAVDDYLIAHFLAARTFVPVLEPGGSYVFINGPLAFESMFEGSGLVSVVTAAQAMLARVLMKEIGDRPVRLNEVVVYTPFGWGDQEPAPGVPSREEIARYVALLVSPDGASLAGRTIHLKSREPLQSFASAPSVT